jgi:hypothetical protein
MTNSAATRSLCLTAAIMAATACASARPAPAATPHSRTALPKGVTISDDSGNPLVISGSLTNGRGVPLRGAWVMIQTVGARVAADTTGAFRWIAPRSGSFVVKTQALAFTPQIFTVTVATDRGVHIRAAMEESMPCAMVPLGPPPKNRLKDVIPQDETHPLGMTTSDSRPIPIERHPSPRIFMCM